MYVIKLKDITVAPFSFMCSLFIYFILKYNFLIALCLIFHPHSSPTYFPAENLTEYKWPSDDTGEYYMLQEQVSEYLGVTSFKRKYPGKTDVKI